MSVDTPIRSVMPQKNLRYAVAGIFLMCTYFLGVATLSSGSMKVENSLASQLICQDNSWSNLPVALNNPDGCKWIWGDGEELIMDPGGVYAMNLSYDHSVVNLSDEARMHMIIARHDAQDEWKRLMEESASRQGVSGEYVWIDELP